MASRDYQQIYGRAFIAVLAFLPLIGAIAPRFEGLGPVLLALIAVLGFRGVYGAWPALSRRALLWSLAFPALMTLSALWSPYPGTALDRAMRTLPVTLSAGVIFSLGMNLDKRSCAEFVRLFPFALAACGLICVIELYAQGPLYHLFHHIKNPSRPFNFSLINRSVVVFTLSAFAAFLCVSQDCLTRRNKTLITALILALTLLILVKTDSQSSLLAFILGGFFFLAFPARLKPVWNILAGLLVLILCAAPWLAEFMFAHFAAPLFQIKALKQAYMPHRMEIWDFVSRRALERPFIGWGTESTKMMTFDTAQLYQPGKTILHPHNFAIQLWIEYGVIGAAIGAAFFIDILRRMRDLPPAISRGLIAIFIASLSIAATGYGLWQSWWLGTFCLLFAYAAILIKAYKTHESREI